MEVRIWQGEQGREGTLDSRTLKNEGCYRWKKNLEKKKKILDRDH